MCVWFWGTENNTIFSVNVNNVPRLGVVVLLTVVCLCADSADRPLVLFSLPDVRNTTTLLLSDDGNTLYVGARDAVLSLDVSRSDVIRLKKKVEWRPSDSEIKDCEGKGKDATVDCPNFVRVLQPMNSTHLYACGSYAYSPHDAFIDAESFSMVQHADTKAKVRCPFSPMQKSTAITVDGELFTATTTNFRGVEPQISRHFSKDGRQDISQDSSVSLLEDPTFVSSASDPSDQKLYFFFNEVGKEFNFVDNLRIARVAQVCKDDVGGQRTLQNKWTSFAKTSLLCQVPKQLPFNVLQDVFMLPPPEGGNATDTLFYGVFTSQWSLGPESSVCVFTLQDIRAVFTGTYKNLDFQKQQWSTVLGKHSYLGQCGLDSASDSELEQVKKSFLTARSVTPVGGSPVVVSSGQQYSHVTALRTQAANRKQHTVLFLLTESGFLHKVVLLERGAQVVEEIQVFSQPQLVKSIVLSSSKGVLYVGTSEGVTAVPLARCSGYRTCSQCVLARDPLCGWSRTAGVCTTPDAQQHDMYIRKCSMFLSLFSCWCRFLQCFCHFFSLSCV
ncbi:semaphorin-4A-like [Sander vitreus]